MTLTLPSFNVELSLDITAAGDWLPAIGEECWTPNLLEHKGEPLCFNWNDTENDRFLMLQRRVHKREMDAFRQQVDINRLFFAVFYS